MILELCKAANRELRQRKEEDLFHSLFSLNSHSITAVMDKVVSLLTSFPSDLPAKKDSGKKYHQTAEAFVDAVKGLSEAQLLQQTRDKQGILEVRYSSQSSFSRRHC